MKIVSFLVSLMLGCYVSLAYGSCEEHIGVSASSSGDYELAYEALKDCETDSEATGRSLHYLQAMIWFQHYKSFDSMGARYIYTQKLVCRSAIKGYSPSVIGVASKYWRGDKSLGAPENDEIRACLYSIKKISLEYVDPEEVRNCLSLNPDIDPDYQCY